MCALLLCDHVTWFPGIMYMGSVSHHSFAIICVCEVESCSFYSFNFLKDVNLRTAAAFYALSTPPIIKATFLRRDDILRIKLNFRRVN